MIAIDAMGGDYAPHAMVLGSLPAARSGIALQLYGNQELLEKLLNEADESWRSLPITVVDCSEVINMGEEPTRAVRKKDSSLYQAVYAVSRGVAQAVVTAGNSGSALVTSMLVLETIPGITRPAIGTLLPTQTGGTVFCLDLGANVDAKAVFLEQFAYMGHAYVQAMRGIEHPRIALLSNGEEQYKGPANVRQAYELLNNSTLNFIGNIEPNNIFNGHTDVVVSDGFAGNIMLKTIEGTVAALMDWLKRAFNTNLFTKFIGLLCKPIFKKIKKQCDYAQQGGALLLGVKHPVIIAHGCSDARAFEHAVRYAHAVVQKKVIQRFNERFAVAIATRPVPSESQVHSAS
jgi:glycerol-3-phosphate acyltransferase PlsX